MEHLEINGSGQYHNIVIFIIFLLKIFKVKKPCKYSFFSFSLLRKIALSYHLLPIFLFLLEEDLPWANICSSLPLLCIWLPTIAWPPTSSVCLRLGTEPRPLKQSTLNLITRPQGWPQEHLFLIAQRGCLGWRHSGQFLICAGYCWG